MKKIKILLVSIFLVNLFLFGGCTAVIHDMYVGGSPAYMNVLENTPALEPGEARIVFYYPRLPLAGLSLGAVGGFGVLEITVEGEGGHLTTEIMDQTAFSIDVPAGKYSIKEKGGGVLNSDFEALKTHYVKFTSNPGMLHRADPFLINEQQALKELKDEKISSAHFKWEWDPHSLRLGLIPGQEKQWANTSQSGISRDASCIYLFNTKSPMVGPFMKLMTGVDCEPKHIVDSKKYICYQTEPGKHVLTAHAVNLGVEMIAPVGIEVIKEKGRNLYLAYGLQKGFRILSAQEGEKLLKKYKATENGFYH